MLGTMDYIFDGKGLDRIDLKILDTIKDDARLPLKTIASRCRVSKQTALYRINRLVGSGVIAGFHAKINHSRLGYSIYYVYIQTRYIDDEKKFIERLSRITGCLVIMKSVTQYGYNLRIMTRNSYDMVHELEGFFNKEKNVTSHFILQRLEKPSGSYDFDDVDARILSELSIDCRQNDLELSRKLKLGYDIVHNRVRKLVKESVIEKFQTIIIFEQQGFMYYNMLIKFSDDNLERLPMFDSLLGSDSLVLERFRTVGEFSYVFEIVDKDFKSINEKLNKIRSQFHDMIRNSQLVPIENHHFYKARFD